MNESTVTLTNQNAAAFGSQPIIVQSEDDDGVDEVCPMGCHQIHYSTVLTRGPLQEEPVETYLNEEKALQTKDFRFRGR